jgi:hypothetical protein
LSSVLDGTHFSIVGEGLIGILMREEKQCAMSGSAAAMSKSPRNVAPAARQRPAAAVASGIRSNTEMMIMMPVEKPIPATAPRSLRPRGSARATPIRVVRPESVASTRTVT